MKRRCMLLGAVIAVLSIFAGFAAARGNERIITGASDGVCIGNQVYLIDNRGATIHVIHAKRSGGMVGEIVLPKLKGSWWDAYRFLTVDKKSKVGPDPDDRMAYVYRYGTSMETVEEQSAVLRCNFATGKLEPAWQLPGVKLHGIQVSDGVLYYAAPKDTNDPDSNIAFYSADMEGHTRLLASYDFPYGKSVSTCYSVSTKTAMWSDYNGRIYYNGKEVQTKKQDQNESVHIMLEDQGTVLTNLTDNETELIPIQGGRTENLFSIDQVQLKDLGLEYSDLLPFGYDSDQIWLAGVNLVNGNRGLGIFDRSGKRLQVITEVRPTTKACRVKGLEAGAVCFIVLSLVAGCGFLFFKYTKGTPVVLKLMAILIPVILVCSYQLSIRIYGSFKDRVIRMEENLLYEIADQQLSACRTDDLSAIDVDGIPDDPAYQKLFGYTDHFRSDKVMFTAKGVRMPVTVRTYRWLYLLKNGTLRYAIVDDNYYGGKVSYDRDREQMALIRQSLMEKRVIASEYNDQEGSWVVLYLPVFGAGGSVIGVMESGMSQGVILYEIGQEIQVLYRLIFLIMGILCGLLAIVLSVFLYPLRRLKAAVSAMAAGELGCTVKTAGRDEVAGITVAFNEMSLKIQAQMEFIRACLEGYEKFVPGRLFAILNRKDVTEVELGDQKEIVAAVLAAGAGEFEAFQRNARGEELYAAINRMMRAMIPPVSQRDGVVDKMADAGITAFYTSGCEAALRSAIAICENGNRAENGEPFLPKIQIGVTYATVRLGIVGQGNRAAAATISEFIPFTEYLRKLALKYGASILIDKTAADQIRDFETAYHSRMIGYVLITRSGRVEPVYDVYDGDFDGQRRKKEDTKPLFAAAMESYAAGRYYEARERFAGVLKGNRDDRAAREYIYRCDAYYQMADTSGIEIYLEKY